MSSFIGHSLAAVTIYAIGRPPRQWRWMGWLILIALVPDLDYAIPALQASHHSGLRITHSIAASLLLPMVAWLLMRSQHTLTEHRWPLTPMALAGLSHLAMDLFVGVTPLPLLWPLPIAFKLPFGLLPSAGRLQFSNALMYHNLGIELGVMIPGLLLVFLVFKRRGHPLFLATLGTISTGFMIWASQLSR